MKREGHNGIPRTGGDESVATIEQEIRRNRAEMDHTLEELSRRLEPRRLADDLWGTVRDRIPTGSDAAHKAQDLGGNIARRIGAHPIPSAIVGAGLLWLLVEEARGERTHVSDITRGLKEGARAAGKGVRRVGEAAAEQARHMRSSGTAAGSFEGYEEYQEGHYVGTPTGSASGIASRAGERLSHTGERAAERMKDSAWRARQRLSHTGDRMAGAASQTGERVRGMASQAGDTLSRAYEDHPIAVGMAAMGAGLLAGIAVPNTRRENEAIGPAAERMRRQAMESAERTVGQALDTAEEKADEFTSKAEEKLGQHRGEGKREEGQKDSWASTAQPYREPPKIPPSPPTVP